MEIVLSVMLIVVSIACFLYIVERWKNAVTKRDVEWTFRPGAGISFTEKNRRRFGICSSEGKPYLWLNL